MLVNSIATKEVAAKQGPQNADQCSDGGGLDDESGERYPPVQHPRSCRYIQGETIRSHELLLVVVTGAQRHFSTTFIGIPTKRSEGIWDRLENRD